LRTGVGRSRITRWGVVRLPRAALAPLAVVVALGAPAPAAAQAPAPSPSAPPSYVISTGDVLQVMVWKEPELSRDVTVRQDGRITLPLVGDVVAAGRTPSDVGSDLTRQLTRYVEAPMVTVAVAQANSTRVYVLGQVKNPGAFPLAGRLSLVQALALAGGLTEFAKSDRILVIREDAGQRAPYTVSFKKLESDNDLSQNLALRPGDTIVVP
jgi:polysaccharide export outer membrane protein